MAVCVPSTCRTGVLRAAMDSAAGAVNARIGWNALRLQLDHTAVAGPSRKPTLGDYMMMCVAIK